MTEPLVQEAGKAHTIRLLDHGYVKFVDSMGSDEDIVEAARMSTGKGFIGWGVEETCAKCNGSGTNEPENGPGSLCKVCHGRKVAINKPGDEKLLTHLYENRHDTPFEMAEMVIQVKAPIMVFREWHRHRTQCLAGDTAVNLVTPRGTTYKRTIGELFQLKHGGVIDTAPRTKNGYSKAGTPVTRAARHKHPWRVRMLPNCQVRVLRTFDEEAGTYRIGVMRDVWESGVKELWAVNTTGGVVRASAEHPFLTRSGWAKLRDIRTGELIATSGKVATSDRPIPPSLRSGIGVWTTMMRGRLIAPRDTCYVCRLNFGFEELELDHVVPVSENLSRALDETNLKPICQGCHLKKSATEQPLRVGRTALGLRWARVLDRPVRVAEEMTYDLEMTGPDHNYVANGLVVHNSYNEMSARYTPLPDENYIPTVERLLINAGTSNKQAGTIKDAAILDEEGAHWFQLALHTEYDRQEAVYQAALHRGVPKELARAVLPVGRYSVMRAKTDLRNWLAFLTLRSDSNAQWEIRQYAYAVGHFISKLYPRTWDLWLNHDRKKPVIDKYGFMRIVEKQAA